ncbi:UNKNOWN [Stylonychia lemnae]|uniref:Uncharacterized protein n=1 Tax=Stylonychia lemnae TaxID=5949 RepID=A0A078B132_STYLE|nr:UNKNOWN [Stylonychia lemnae]|eukprot:CDW87067.1 UNKNOWN [Stylonychia lemnae]
MIPLRNDDDSEEEETLIGYMEKRDRISGINDQISTMRKLQKGLDFSKIDEKVQNKVVQQDKLPTVKKNQLKTRTNLKFDFDPDESDSELPTIIRVGKPQISNKDYLKLFNTKNQPHNDRERANSISENLVMPLDPEFYQNPLFNKQKKLEKNLNLHLNDLFSISQIEELKVLNRNQQAEYDDQIFENNLKQLVLDQKVHQNKINQYISKYSELDSPYAQQFDIQDLNPEYPYDSININQIKYQRSLSKFQMRLFQIIENKKKRQQEQDLDFKILDTNPYNQTLPENASNLTREVLISPQIKLKKLFCEKVKELDLFQKDKILDQYDSNTLSNLRRKGESVYRIHLREKIKENNYKLIDQNIENAVKIPKEIKQRIKKKFNIKEKELEPFFKEEQVISQKFSTVKVNLKPDQYLSVMDLNKIQYQKELKCAENNLE